MHVAIDYSAAVWQGAGIGRYSRALVGALLRLDRENRYTLLYPRGWPGRPAPFLGHLAALRRRHPNLRLRPLPLSDRWTAILWQRLRLPLPVELFCGRVDCFYSPDFVLPPQIGGRRVLTVHDLAFMVHPECAVPSLEWYLHGAVSRALERADLVLADSECTRQDLIRLKGADPQRVRVLYLGVEEDFRPLEDHAALERVRARYELPERFLFTVGTIQPRKNLPRLLQALASLPEALRLPLVVAGKPGWLYEETFAAVERLSLQSWVRFLGFTPDEDLPALLNLALALVYPSLYEGFGLPPLEAMACGTPVLTSDAASLPEVVGEAAVLVDPLDVAGIAAGLRRLIEDGALRQSLRAAGLERARGFSWERSARQLLEFLGQG
ncbi:MAG: glycosyltransferase family 4 protein [Chloroflexia bacterium]|nr:glycosyltransferase family 4 protein [Chloroflexia bacterium]